MINLKLGNNLGAIMKKINILFMKRSYRLIRKINSNIQIMLKIFLFKIFINRIKEIQIKRIVR
jgi:hypothetical protein